MTSTVLPKRLAIDVLKQHSAAIEAVMMAGRRGAVMSPIEAQLEKQLAYAWKQQKRVFMAKFENYKYRFSESIGSDEFDAMWQDVVSSTQQMFSAPLIASAEDAYSVGQQVTLSGLSPAERQVYARATASLNLANPRAVEYARANAATRVSSINDTTRDQMRTIITTGTDEGRSYNRIAQQIRSTFDGFSTPSPIGHIKDRAQLVAVTELAFAYGAGTRQTANTLSSAGLDMEKSWLPTTDPCDLCDGNDNEGWIDLEDSFFSGDENIPAHPGCRCDMLYRRKGSLSDLGDLLDNPIPEDTSTVGRYGGLSAFNSSNLEQVGADTRKAVNFLQEDNGGDRFAAKSNVERVLERDLRDNEAYKMISSGGKLDMYSYDSSYSTTRELIANWAGTSGDDNAIAVAMQRAAKTEFNLGESTLEHLTKEYVDAGFMQAEQDGLRAFVRAQYELTQKDLAEHGIEEMTLYRGMYYKANEIPEEVTRDWAFDGTVQVRSIAQQPMSSFSADMRTSFQFTGQGDYNAMIAVRVPAARILSTPRTGFGCLEEQEFVVLGATEDVTVIPFKSAYLDDLISTFVDWSRTEPK